MFPLQNGLDGLSIINCFHFMTDFVMLGMTKICTKSPFIEKKTNLLAIEPILESRDIGLSLLKYKRKLFFNLDPLL